FERLALVVHGDDARLVVVAADGGRGQGAGGRERATGERAVDGPEALPRAPRGVNRCVWHPDGTRLLVTIDPVGAEHDAVAELDAATGAVLWSTGRPDAVHALGPIMDTHPRSYHPRGTAVAYSSSARDAAVLDVVVRDLTSGEETIVLRADDRYYPVAWSPDGGWLLVKRVHQNTEHDLFVCRPGTGEVRRLTRTTARYHHAGWAADGDRIVVLTDAGQDLLAPALLDAATGRLRWPAGPGPDGAPAGAGPRAEVSRLAVAADGRHVVWGHVRDGRSSLVVCDRVTGARGTVPGLARGVLGEPANKTGHGALHLSRDGTTLITRLDSPTTPAEAYRIDLLTGRARRLTHLGARVPVAGLVEPAYVTVTNRDGLPMRAQLYRPATPGPAPVVILLHGGPEDAHSHEYAPDIQGLLRHGIGVLAPDIRGSVGYGRSFQRLSVHDWGGGDVRDVVDCVDHLRGLGWVDPGRLGLMGASYGGFLTLACLVRHPHLWSAAVDLFGPSDLVRDAEAMPPHWQGRLAGWLGDLGDPADRARLTEHSPITHADRITTPLLVVQGDHDPRVPPEQSNRLVARLTELGRPVTLITMADEGHGLDNHHNWHRVNRATVDWFRVHLTAA
ncbi:MAG TPA: alpha/beta fold hydrolase, partial [Micromonospora sp.]